MYVDKKGYYGSFGGAFIPEMMHKNVSELEDAYVGIINSPDFIAEYDAMLHDYVGRPTPLYFAVKLSAKYNCRIYLKREDLCHTGSHKLNNVAGQALLAKRMGKKAIIAETGAGQHGVATATVCALLGLKCIVFMGDKDMKRQYPNVMRMKMLGAEVIPAMSGSQTLKDATNEAIRYWINNPDNTHYLIGSVIGPHPYPDLVARFQSVISREIKNQLLEKEGREQPDAVIACVGGGSNAAGSFFEFIDKPSVRLIGAEAGGCGVNSGKTAATMAAGKEGIIHGCKTRLIQTADGQIVEAHSVSAGLDYPGVGPLHTYLFESGRADYIAVDDDQALEAAFELTKLEGIIPALESSHALALLKKIKFKPDNVVVICLSGRGDKDLETYMNIMNQQQ
ncbi:MAG TPA: tryptophan synthase subunit beta [Bacteroidales bacterium]|nr:tryptophan synthase subunit beta [Bacteroidales bacterium]